MRMKGAFKNPYVVTIYRNARNFQNDDLHDPLNSTLAIPLPANSILLQSSDKDTGKDDLSNCQHQIRSWFHVLQGCADVALGIQRLGKRSQPRPTEQGLLGSIGADEGLLWGLLGTCWGPVRPY